MYLLTLKHDEIVSPYPGVPLSVPDIYSIRTGGAFTINAKRGSFSELGMAIDGILSAI